VKRSPQISVWIPALLLAGRLAAPGQATWQSAVQLDPGNSGSSDVFYSPERDLRVFYNVDDTIDKMYVRTRTQGQTDFDPQAFVYNDARAVGIHYAGGSTIDLAVATASSAIVLASTNSGRTWTWKKTYSARNTGTFPSYLPLCFTEDGEDLRLIYSYQYDTGLFGAHAQVYTASRTSGAWQANGTFLADGAVCGACENGDEVCIVHSGGVLYSTNNGLTYTSIGVTSYIPERLTADDMAVGPDGRIYLLRTYSYGMGPNDKHLSYTYSDDHGASWYAPQIVITSRQDYMFSPRLAVDSNRMVAVWRHAVIPNQHQFIQCVISESGGAAWGPVETIVSVGETEKITSAAIAAAPTTDGRKRMSMVYDVDSGGTNRHVYLKELLPPPDLTGVSGWGATLELSFSGLLPYRTNAIQRTDDLAAFDSW